MRQCLEKDVNIVVSEEMRLYVQENHLLPLTPRCGEISAGKSYSFFIIIIIMPQQKSKPAGSQDSCWKHIDLTYCPFVKPFWKAVGHLVSEIVGLKLDFFSPFCKLEISLKA